MTDETITDPTLDAPAVDAAAAPADPVQDAAAVAGDPSLAEAEAMFADNPGLAAVLTTDGWLSRDGILTPVLTGA